MPATVNRRPAFSIANLTPDEIRTIEPSLKPMGESMEGFIGHQETLRDGWEAKDKVLKSMGMTYAGLAQSLASVLVKADYGPKRIGSVDVKLFQTKGSQTCPFVPHGKCSEEQWLEREGSFHVTLTDPNSGKVLMKIPSLMPHMIREHEWLEGDTSWGLRPQEAVELLGLQQVTECEPEANSPPLGQ